MEEVDREIFEYCSLCNAFYNLKGRKQHLLTKKHCNQLKKMNITDDDVPIEHYSLTCTEVVESNSDHE